MSRRYIIDKLFTIIAFGFLIAFIVSGCTHLKGTRTVQCEGSSNLTQFIGAISECAARVGG